MSEDMILTDSEKAIIMFTRELEAERNKRGPLDDKYIRFLGILHNMPMPDDDETQDAILELLALMVLFICPRYNLYNEFKDFMWEMHTTKDDEE